MRVWEVEDNKAIPSDMVREQDFILRVRRLHRIGSSHLLVNAVLSAVPAATGGRGPLEVAQQRLRDFATATHGVYAEMSNGDSFLIWPESAAAQDLATKILGIILSEGAGGEQDEAVRLVYHLPRDYAALRERVSHYVEVSRAAEISNEGRASQLLQTEAARGPLTAWSVDLIEKLLLDIDLRRYVRSQPVYERLDDGRMLPLFEEFAIGFEDLRKTYFPRLEIATAEHLFLELCQALDRQLLVELTQNFEAIAGRQVSLNLSVKSVLGSVFAQFARRAPRAEHGKIRFELHRGDLLQDFSETLNAIEVIRREGFQVGIDGVTPDMLRYFNMDLLDVDFIKLNVDKDRAAQLKQAATLQALMRIPRERLIFFRCDSEAVLAIGLELGVRKYQGWLVDALARAK